MTAAVFLVQAAALAQLALDQLAKIGFTTLADIGCGDGRFLREVAQAYPGKQLLGIAGKLPAGRA